MTRGIAMRKTHGWYIVFVGYVFELLGISILVSYLQSTVNVVAQNPYVLLTIILGMILGAMGTYVVHRSTQ